MGLPDVDISLENGNLGGSQATPDGVVGLIVTGTAVDGKLELGKYYLFSSTRDLVTRGIDAQTNPLLEKEVKAFYAQTGEGAELHIIVVSDATTLTAMTEPVTTSPLSKLINNGKGRIKIVGINKIAPAEYVADTTKGIDGDAITAAANAHQSALSYAKKIKPFRVLIPCPSFKSDSENLYKPAEASYNRVLMVLASDDEINNTAAIGQILGRAAILEPQQSLSMVEKGSIAPDGHFTSGETVVELEGMAGILHDAGYVFYRHFTQKNGCYINDDRMAAPRSDDYCFLNNARIIDKVSVIIYATYIEDIQSNVLLDDGGKISQAAAIDFQKTIENAVMSQAGAQISKFKAHVDPSQIATVKIKIACSVRPVGTLKDIEVSLGFNL